MGKICLVLITLFSFANDRWDITEPQEYVDIAPEVEPDKSREPDQGSRGPASLKPEVEELVHVDVHEELFTKVSIIATGSGFLPNEVQIPLNKAVEITVMTNKQESCFVSSDLGIHAGLRKGDLHKFYIPPQRKPKVFDFHCALDRIKGKFIVDRFEKVSH